MMRIRLAGDHSSYHCGSAAVVQTIATELRLMKQRGDERLSATSRCDIQLAVAMKEHLDAIAHALQSRDVR